MSNKSKDFNMVSDPESMEDEIIRHKIQEANQLIERVRQALGKIKAIQSGDESGTQSPIKKTRTESSSTDIEETIKGLKLQTQELLKDEPTVTAITTRTKSSRRRTVDLPKSRHNGRQSRDTSATRKNKDEEEEVTISQEQKVVVKTPREDTECSEIVTIKSKSKIPRPVQQTQTEDSDRIVSMDTWQVVNAVDLERPRTRRNEAEDDLVEQIRRDKFRTIPDTNQLEISSSFEELQEKLKTIAETTESNRSTPRTEKSGEKLQPEDQHLLPQSISDNDNCSPCAQPVSKCNQNVQANPETICVGVECRCQTQDQSNQGKVLPKLAAANRIATDFVPPKNKSLKQESNLPTEIAPTKLWCTSCKTEFFLSDVNQSSKSIKCENCQGSLHEDFVGGISIEPEIHAKVHKLSIKLLPPVIIRPPLRVIKVLDLSINSNGDALNRLKNRNNVGYVDVIHGKELIFDRFKHFQSFYQDQGEENKDDNRSEENKDDNFVSKTNSSTTEKTDNLEPSNTSTESNLDPVLLHENKMPEVFSTDTNDNIDTPVKMVMKYVPKDVMSEPEDDKGSYLTPDLKRSERFGHSRTASKATNDDWVSEVRAAWMDTFAKKNDSNIFHTLEKEKEAIYKMQRDPNLTEEQRQELKKKLLWYQSYHIYDNPNLHDPGRMDQKSLEKLSHVDLEFYKTFINPEPHISGELTPVYSRSRTGSKASKTRLGYDSKQIQVQPSLLGGLDDPNQVPTKLACDMVEDSDETLGNKEIKQFNAEKKYDSLSDTLPGSSEPPIRPSMDPTDDVSQVTILNLKQNQLDQEFIASQGSKGVESKSILRPPQGTRGSSTPSEITVTISYTLSEEEARSDIAVDEPGRKSKSDSLERELNSTMLDRDQSNIKNISSRTLTLADKDVMEKLRNKLKSVDTTASLPGFTIRDEVHRETLDNFLKGLTQITTAQNRQSTKSVRLDTSSNSDKTFDNNPDKTVNYVFTQNNRSPEHFGSHLELAENGRYRDEQHMFTQLPYPVLTHSPKKTDIRKPPEYPLHERPLRHLDAEVERDKYEFIPRRKLKKYFPDTSNSDTVTTASISEGEIAGCKQSLSIGEIHVCRHRPQCPKARKALLNRRTLGLSPPPSPLKTYLRKKFDLSDPTVSIEQRRTYFNNWVTYYVKPQEVYQSSNSNFSNIDNK